MSPPPHMTQHELCPLECVLYYRQTRTIQEATPHELDRASRSNPDYLTTNTFREQLPTHTISTKKSAPPNTT
ncbi:hypothetical protein ACN081_02990 [Rothia sp. P13129]|uniref:hypothetical protein n=1 Tax=Rothia sp. P13129 TaxID=3402664 RepID=UPI003ABFD61F